MINDINDLSISLLTQSKIQGVLDEVALDKLIENQTSEREKAQMLSLSLHQSGAWLSAPLLSPGLHLMPNDFRAAVKYRRGALIYKEERKWPYSKTGSVDTLGDHAVTCHRRDNIILGQDRLRDKIFFRSQRCQPVTSLRAEKPDAINRFLTWRCVFTMLVCWATSSTGCNHNLPTATQCFFKCGEEVQFCPESCGRQEVRVVFPTMCQHRC